MLSDKGSVVIGEFGILNTNVPPDVARFYGIPFPGQYLIAPDGTVRTSFFLLTTRSVQPPPSCY